MLRHFFEIIPFYLLIIILKMLPFEKRVFWGGQVCGLILPLVRKYYERVDKNLRLIYPTLSEKKRKEFIKENSEMIGKSFIELMFNKEFQKRTNNIEYNKKALAPLIEAKKLNRPIIIISGHIGSWEAVRAVLKKYGLTSAALYQRNRNIFYERLHLCAIKEGGEPIFEVGRSGTRKMISLIKSGGVVALMIDQAVKGGEYFKFLGTPARTSTSIAEISLKYHALLIPAYGIRTNVGGIKVTFDKPIELKSVSYITKKMNFSLERRVNESPTQWYWPHKRWK
ncbi:lysophospholipid acyltransferase family protein [Paracoccaceae bacterium]|nr:lysophospholipid acyltransferase family protein [Paracoccaceae bacterium]